MEFMKRKVFQFIVGDWKLLCFYQTENCYAFIKRRPFIKKRKTYFVLWFINGTNIFILKRNGNGVFIMKPFCAIRLLLEFRLLLTSIQFYLKIYMYIRNFERIKCMVNWNLIVFSANNIYLMSRDQWLIFFFSK